MKTTKTTRTASPLFFSAALAASLVTTANVACVTVNVNFPEATVQKATDDYVRDLYRAKEKGRTPSPGGTASDPAASGVKPSSKPSASKGSGFDSLFISSAYAAPATEANFKVATDKSAAIHDKLASRLDKVLDGKRSGNLGESNDGYLAVDPGGNAKPLLKKSLQPLADAENKDRKELYEEIQRANNLPKSRIVDIQKSFARSFQAESPSGTWAQDAEGKWAQKP
jgi:uncharacterized protein YdbL (DUF1318 family)